MTKPLVTAAAVLSLVLAPGCKTVREKALYQHSLELCKTLPHKSGDDCAAEVEHAFPSCSGPYLAKKTNSAAYAECLGFIVPHGSSSSHEPPRASPRP